MKGFSVKIIADSISALTGQRIVTFELEYPRFIHAEFMTHRLFSRNAASSRAIPIEKMMEQVTNDPAMPIEWGLNQSGMQAKEVHPNTPTCVWAWEKAALAAVDEAKRLQDLGLHKQIVNRVLEPYQRMKTVMTSTEMDNFYWLRCHTDAQPEIHYLADWMYSLAKVSEPNPLNEGEWHLPYVHYVKDCLGNMIYLSEDYEAFQKRKEEEGVPRGKTVMLPSLTLENALKISASCCAQVSYRVLNDSLEKALDIYDKLVSMTPVHASPFEHQATPVKAIGLSKAIQNCTNLREWPMTWQEGVTHVDRKGNLWSGNFKGWIQNRQLIENNACWEFEKDI